MEGWIASVGRGAPASIVLGRFHVGRNARGTTEYYMIVARKYRRANIELPSEGLPKPMPEERSRVPRRVGYFRAVFSETV